MLHQAHTGSIIKLTNTAIPQVIKKIKIKGKVEFHTGFHIYLPKKLYFNYEQVGAKSLRNKKI